MFHQAIHYGHLAIEAYVRTHQLVLRQGCQRPPPEHARLTGGALQLVVDGARFTKLRPVIFPEPIRQLADVSYGQGNRIRQASVGIGADLNLYAGKPPAAFLVLMLLRVELRSFLLRRRRRMDDRSLDHHGAVKQQSSLFRRVVDDIQQRCGQPVLQQQSPKLQDSCLVQLGFVEQCQSGKAAHVGYVIKSFSHTQVSQVDQLQMKSVCSIVFRGQGRRLFWAFGYCDSISTTNATYCTEPPNSTKDFSCRFFPNSAKIPDMICFTTIALCHHCRISPSPGPRY